MMAHVYAARAALPHMKVRARVYSLEGKLLADKEESVDVPADGTVKAFDLPKAEGLTMSL